MHPRQKALVWGAGVRYIEPVIGGHSQTVRLVLTLLVWGASGWGPAHAEPGRVPGARTPAGDSKATAALGGGPTVASRVVDRRLEGFYWDHALWLGGGVRLRRPLVPTFAAQLRYGGLWASEPWTFHGGFVGQIGGFAELGGGIELEVNHLDGWFLSVNVALSHRGFAIAGVRTGYWMFGLAYERSFDALKPADPADPADKAGGGALLAILRLPFGLSAAVQESSEKALAVLAATELPPRSRVVAAPTRDRAFARSALVRAERSRLRKDWSAVDQALREAWDADPQLSTLEQLYQLRLERKHWVEAADLLAGALRNPVLSLSRAERSEVQVRLRALRRDIPVARIDSGAAPPAAHFAIDGDVCPGVQQGYDCPLNPGDHILEMRGHAAKLLWTRRFTAAPGQVVRLRVREQGAPVPSEAP